jgi:hypothetical protein
MRKPKQRIEKSRKYKATNKVWLTVPFEDKDIVKTLGAKWDANKKRWYAPDIQTEKQVQMWIPYKPVKQNIKHL